MVTKDYFGIVYRYYEESDLAECRACHVRPEYRTSNTTGAGHVVCPKCGIRTGTSASGLERVLPAWNAVMDDSWPASDPKMGVI